MNLKEIFANESFADAMLTFSQAYFSVTVIAVLACASTAIYQSYKSSKNMHPKGPR